MAALPQIVLPDYYGSSHRKLPRFAVENQLESSATAYVGLLATLFWRRLAFLDGPSRWRNCFWLFLAVLGLAWSLNLPGFVQVLRMPANMFSHNRFTLAAALGLLRWP